MSQTPSELPPPPAQPATPEHAPTEIAGQQITPSTAVPHVPGLETGVQMAAGKTNSLAIVSFVASIGSFFAHIIPGIGGFTVALVAIITGFMARKQIQQTHEQGMWMANAGIIIGFIHLGLLVIGVIVLLFLIFVLGIAMFGLAAHSSSQ